MRYEQMYDSHGKAHITDLTGCCVQSTAVPTGLLRSYLLQTCNSEKVTTALLKSQEETNQPLTSPKFYKRKILPIHIKDED